MPRRLAGEEPVKSTRRSSPLISQRTAIVIGSSKPSEVMEYRYSPGRSAAIAWRMARSVREMISSASGSSRSRPNSSMNSSRRSPPTVPPATCAWKSPITRSGTRVLARMIAASDSLSRPPS